MQRFHSVLILIACGLSLAVISCGETNRPSDGLAETALAAPAETQGAAFQAALNEAGNASQLIQGANKSEEWEAVVLAWEEAVARLKEVPESDQNYSTAQQKIKEYQAKLAYSRQNFLNVSLGDALVKTNSTAEEIQSLIDQGADPRLVEPDILGDPTPKLYYAANFGNDQSVKTLLNAGATWDQLNRTQLDDALIGASCTGYIFTVNELLKAGANPNASNDHGESPLQLAQSETCMSHDMTGPIEVGTRQHQQIASALKAAGARPVSAPKY
jgi:hypothetical protein